MMFKDELDNRLLYINSVIKEFLPESDNELYMPHVTALRRAAKEYAR